VGVFIKIGLFKSPLLRGFPESQISRLCANLSSETDLQKENDTLRQLSSSKRLALFRFAPLENSKSPGPKK
jgi:hypothetical protein